MQQEGHGPKRECANLHPSEAAGALYIKYASCADQEGKTPLLGRPLVPVSREAGICSGAPPGAEDDVGPRQQEPPQHPAGALARRSSRGHS